MSFRCTPFGLFAGCSIAEFEDISNIQMSYYSKYKRFTRLDMDYLCNLVLHLSKTNKIRSLLSYYPNTTYYLVGNKLRYIEYKYINGIRKHQISSIQYSPYLKKILRKAENGAELNKSQKHLSHKYRFFKTQIENILDKTKNNKIQKVFISRSKHQQELIEKILKEEKENEALNTLLASYTHMMMNRWFCIKQRIQEAIIYDLLYKYYKSKIARLDRNNQF